jgi:uncharacterized protein (TIGR03435 family)
MNIRRLFSLIASLTFGALLSTAPHLLAQQPSQTTAAATALPVYDVVSIRENKSSTNGMTIDPRGASFVATNVTLTTLLMNAYDIRSDLTSGLPGWANSVHFDVNAKVSDPDINALKNLSREQRRAMLITLLVERFHLKAHIETKTLPTYDLVIAKGGPRLKENTSHPGSMIIYNSKITAVGFTISNLAANLAFIVERNVVDKTGLTGKYDITLKWRPDDQESAGTDNNDPDLFTALQEQLGLKLESSKGPVDTLVIDHAEMPTAN